MSSHSDISVTRQKNSIARGIRQFAFIVFIGVFVKLFVFDTSIIKGSQMEPTLQSGDRLFLFKTPFLPGIQNIFKVNRNDVVVFKNPDLNGKMNCLRVIAVSGDTIEIDSGKIKKPLLKKKHVAEAKLTSIIPATFSPRDFLTPYRIPKPGDSISLEGSGIRDFFYSVTIIRQENPKSKITVKPRMFVGDSIIENFRIEKFSLYKGSIDSIPEQFQFDWFFWDRLNEYLQYSFSGKNFLLSFSLLKDGTVMDKYKVQDSYMFVLADNWENGLDSRYTGPVSTHSVQSGVLAVLWSWENLQNKNRFRWDRIGRIVR